MCSIAGVLDLSWNRPLIDRMFYTMIRRGPDERGSFEQESCVLLHSRLSVMDPENGQQPMTLSWDGELYTVCYNGELYNTKELREELEKIGHQFHTRCDTEIVLHSYAQWGAKCVDRFNGIFAMAIWEQGRKRLFLARDRMGVKPLFYKEHNGGLLFASEIKTILCYPTVTPEIDIEGVGEVFLLGPGRTPGSGVFRGIRELKPGWRAYYENGQLNSSCYWKLTDREHLDDFEQTAQQVRYLVTDAINRQCIAHVPLGTFLSGGLDSSLISAICARSIPNLETFSVDYLDNDLNFVPGKFQPESDNAYIQQMIEHIGAQHHWTVLTPEDLIGSLEESTWARDLPGMADVDFSLLAFCKKIRKSVKVALSGECADEIFGGYPWFRDPQIRAAEGFPWAQNTSVRIGLLQDHISTRINGEEFVMDRYRDTIRNCDILPGTDPLERQMKEMTVLNQSWFMQTLLDRKDRMSMYSGLEVRVPFCDYRIAEYLYCVPWKYKDYQGKEKGLLRYALGDVLPKSVAWRKKSPYPKTYDPRYENLVRKRLENVLSDPNAPIFSLIRRDKVKELICGDCRWPWYGQLMGIPQTMAYLLQVNWWLEYYGISMNF